MELAFWKVCARTRNRYEVMMRPLRGLFEAVGWHRLVSPGWQDQQSRTNGTGSMELNGMALTSGGDRRSASQRTR